MPNQPQDILTYGKACRQQGLIINHDGNLSIRRPEGIWITPAGRDKGSLALTDLALVDGEGEALNAACASSEVAIHLALYRAYPQVQAVIHSHPLVATAMTLAGGVLDESLLSEARAHIHPLAYVEDEAPGSQALSEAFARCLGQKPKAVILRGHGVVAWGEDLDQAFRQTMTVERLAQTQWIFQTARAGKG